MERERKVLQIKENIRYKLLSQCPYMDSNRSVTFSTVSVQNEDSDDGRFSDVSHNIFNLIGIVKCVEVGEEM
jgi:hypothetical protein